MKPTYMVFTVAKVERMPEGGFIYDPHSVVEDINEVLLNSTNLEPRLIFR